MLLGRTVYKDFVCHTTAGVVSDADSTPTVEIFENDTDTAILTPTAVKRTSKTGNYRVPIVITAANGFEIGKSYNVVVSATVGGTSSKAVIMSFVIENIGMITGSVVTDGSNTSSTFKTDLAATTTDYHKNALLLFTSGNRMDSPRKVSAFNGSTKFITVSEAFTGTPAAGDTFILLVW